MNHIQLQMLRCLAAYRSGQAQAVCVPGMTDAEWNALYEQCIQQKIESIVFDTLWKSTAFCGSNTSLRQKWKQRAMLQTARQTAHSIRIVEICAALRQAGVPYVLVKGLLCRQLYQRPDLRISGDEDLLIHASDRERAHQALQQAGMVPLPGMQEGDVTHWGDPVTALHIELHSFLFSSAGRPEETWMNTYFDRQLAQAVTVSVPGGSVDTFTPTVHFFFLIAHALKHFLTGGFGIRTLCDMVSFAEQYALQIDCSEVYRLLEQIHGRVFLDQILAAGADWLGFDPEAAGWQYSTEPDPELLVLDSLDAGVYGQSSLSRKHSAGLVLGASEHNGAAAPLRRVLFPSRQEMEGKYPRLREHPALLAACWADRLGRYGAAVLRGHGKENSPLESLSLGRKRTKMMQKYQIIPQQKSKNKK